MQLTLTPAEVTLLHEMLDHYLVDLQMEIARTEHKDFRERLRERERLLERLVAELGPPGPAGDVSRGAA